MTKQEEIREGIKKVISVYFGLDALQEPFLNELPDSMIKYLHSQGLVIKVDGELPGTFLSEAGHAFEKVVQQEMIGAGYTLTEELI